jgi:predicted nuclease of predicted toxin-antitoxin system
MQFTHLTLLTEIARQIEPSTNSLLKKQYIVVTKDSDFVESFLLRREPWKLLLVSTGNINNPNLETLFMATMQRVVEGFDTFDFIEIERTNLIFHL